MQESGVAPRARVYVLTTVQHAERTYRPPNVRYPGSIEWQDNYVPWDVDSRVGQDTHAGSAAWTSNETAGFTEDSTLIIIPSRGLRL